MKKSDEYQESKDAIYVSFMAESLKTLRVVEKKPATTIQSASTQKVLDMSEEELKSYRSREIDLSKAIIPRDQWKKREISAEEYNVYKSMQEASKNTLGQFEGERVSPQRKELARQAFMFSKPSPITEQDKDKIVKLEKIEPLKEIKDDLKAQDSRTQTSDGYRFIDGRIVLEPEQRKETIFQSIKDFFKTKKGKK
jgi:hypothetical protein